MKRLIGLFSIFMLIAIGCSKPETKLVGNWKSTQINGFTAEFKQDHTGTTFTPVPGHAGQTSTQNIPFKWTISDDGKIKITEDKDTFLGKLSGSKLELEVNGAKTILEKIK